MPRVKKQTLDDVYGTCDYPVFLIDADMKPLYRNQKAKDSYPACVDSLREILVPEVAEQAERRMQKKESFSVLLASGDTLRLFPGEQGFWVFGESREPDEQPNKQQSLGELTKRLMSVGYVAFQSSYREKISRLCSGLDYLHREIMRRGDFREMSEMHALEQQVYWLLRNTDNMAEHLRGLSGTGEQGHLVEFWKGLSEVMTEVSGMVPDGIEFRYSLPDKKCLVRCNFQRFVCALINLISNAFQYAGQGSSVSVHGRDTATKVTVTLEDNGKGLPPEIRKRLYEPFNCFRDDVFDPHRLGLGIHVARQIIQSMNGTMTIDCPEGGGTIIQINLPLAKETELSDGDEKFQTMNEDFYHDR